MRAKVYRVRKFIGAKDKIDSIGVHERYQSAEIEIATAPRPRSSTGAMASRFCRGQARIEKTCLKVSYSSSSIIIRFLCQSVTSALTMSTPTPASSFFTTPSGTQLHYLQTGTPSGQTLICLHGIGGSTSTFTPLLPFLPQTLNIILVDFPGHGKTPLPKTQPLSIAGHVNDLHHLITSLQTSSPEAQKVILIGHSLGAAVALHYTAQNHELVAGLALLGVVRAISHIPAARQRMLDLAKNTRENGIGFAADVASKTNFYEDEADRKADPAAREAVRSAVAASDPEGYAQTCEAVADFGHKDPEYEAIKCPAVFVAGDKDIISPVDRSEGLSKCLGGKTWVEVVKSGHQQVLEDSEGVGRAVKGLLDQML